MNEINLLSTNQDVRQFMYFERISLQIMDKAKKEEEKKQLLQPKTNSRTRGMMVNL